MRALILAGMLAVGIPAAAMADENISGQWRTDVDHGVLINMDVLADGHWFSQTIQDNKVVAELAGTYKQTTKDDANGTIDWTPLQGKTTAEHGAPKIETDTYQITEGGKTLKLTTGNETMVFHNTTAQ
jgi:hypothetical protein